MYSIYVYGCIWCAYPGASLPCQVGTPDILLEDRGGKIKDPQDPRKSAIGIKPISGIPENPTLSKMRVESLFAENWVENAGGLGLNI